MPDALTGTGRCAGACGELIQGFLSDGRPIHVSCPIDRRSEVEVRLTPSREPRFTGFDDTSRKMRLACEIALASSGAGPFEVAFTRRSGLDRAKGMASSTADIVATIRAVADALGLAIDPPGEARIAASIERSDGVMYDGPCAVDHRTGELVERLAWHPDHMILMCIPEATFATAVADLDRERRSKPPVDDLLASLQRAARTGDGRLFAETCTESALRNQRYRPDPLLSLLHPHIASLGAQGLCIAHTGTVLGLLFVGPDAAAGADAAKPGVEDLLRGGARLETTTMTSCSR